MAPCKVACARRVSLLEASVRSDALEFACDGFLIHPSMPHDASEQRGAFPFLASS